MNVLGILGISCYIIADTFFISKYAGADGVTVLNLCLPVYNLIFAIGSMIGVGSAIRYAVERESGSPRRDRLFSNALLWVAIIGGLFALTGASAPGTALKLLGGDPGIVELGVPYLRLALMFAPFFMASYVFTAFIRNDGSPGLSMVATFSSSLFNIVFDYIFMFAADLGLTGAALATVTSPVVSILICCLHFFSKGNQIRFLPQRPRLGLLIFSCKVGISAFVSEMASGVATAVFNFLILGLSGNIGVAAYGVIANLATVETALFNGIGQGAQPLISKAHARREANNIKRIHRLGLVTVFAAAALLYLCIWLFTDQLVALFNSEQAAKMTSLAFSGMRIYFIGFFFSGFNIFLASSMSAAEQPVGAAVIALSRGVAAIVLWAWVLSMLGGMTGIWAAYPAAEALTLLLAIGFIRRHHGQKQRGQRLP